MPTALLSHWLISRRLAVELSSEAESKALSSPAGAAEFAGSRLAVVFEEEMPTRKPRRRARRTKLSRKEVLFVTLVALLAVIAFASGVDGPWISDDQFIIAKNPYIQSFEHAGKWLSGTLFPESVERQLSKAQFYRPFITATYAIDWSWGGGSPIAFHLTNLVAHALVAVSGYFAVRRWTGEPTVGFFASALYAVHPAKANSVAWITGRPDIYVTLFLLVSAACHARLRKKSSPLQKNLLLLAKWGSALLALASKEVAIVLPLFYLLEDVAALRGRPLDRAVGRRLVSRVVPALVLVVAYLFARRLLLPIAVDSGPSVGWMTQLSYSARTAGRLMGYFFWPNDLTLFLSVRSVEKVSPFISPWTWLGCAGACAWIAAALVTWRKKLFVHWGLLIVFFVALVPTLNIVPGSTVVFPQPRYLYLPSLPLLTLLCWWASARVRVLSAGGGVLVLVLATLGWQRAAVYSADEAFWAEELRHNPTSPRVLMTISNLDTERYGRKVALERVQCALEASEKHYDLAHSGDLFVRLISLLSQFSEGDKAELQRLREFLGYLRAGAPASLSGRFTLSPSPGLRLKLQEANVQLMAEEAMATWRLEDFARAEKVSRQVLELCGDCAYLRFQLASHALFWEKPRLAQEWVAPLDGLLRERYEQGKRQLEQSSALPEGPPRLVMRVQAAEALGLASHAAYLLHPHIEGVISSQDPLLYQLAAVTFRQAGMIEDAKKFFALVPPPIQDLMLAAGWQPIPPPPPPQFALGTCAFSTEL